MASSPGKCIIDASKRQQFFLSVGHGVVAASSWKGAVLVSPSKGVD